MDASSMAFRGREVLGDEFLWNYALFQGIEIPVLNGWWATHLVRGRQLLDSFNYRQWDPRIIHLGLSENSFPVPFPTVQSGPLSETDPLKADADLGGGTKGNYIQWIVQASVSDLQGGDASENAETIEEILSGKIQGPKRDMTVVNAAGGLVVAGRAKDLKEGIQLAREEIDSGRALEKLRALQNYKP